MIVAILLLDWNLQRKVSQNLAIVEGTVVCVYPMSGKTLDMLCYQFEYKDKLYVGQTGASIELLSSLPGQKCWIRIDSLDPTNEIFDRLDSTYGKIVDPQAFDGEVIWIGRGCNCQLGHKFD